MPKTQTYRTDFGMYAFQLLVWGLPLIVLVVCIFSVGLDSPKARVLLAPGPVAVSFFFPTVVAIWLSRYRLVFEESCLRYRSWQMQEDVIPYSQIESVAISKATPIAKAPVSTHINLTNGSFVIVYTKAFSRAAIKELYSLNSSAQGSNNSFKPNTLRGGNLPR